MKKKNKFNQSHLTAIIIFIILSIGSYVYYNKTVNTITTELQIETYLNQEIIAENLETVIDSRFNFLDDLHTLAYIEHHSEHFNETFKAFGEKAVQQNGIRVLTISPNATHEWVYPLEGNEGVLGHNLLEDTRPEVVESVLRAIENDIVVISGPYELRQGGFGLVARKPVFLENDFWGIVAIVIDIDPILFEAGITENDTRYSYEVSTKDASFFGSINSGIGINKSIINLPEGNWTLYISPKDYPDAQNAYFNTLKTVLGVITIGGALTGYLAISLLTTRIETTRLIESEKRFRTIIGSLPDPVIINDAEKYLFVNQSFANLFEYNTPEEIIGMNILDFYPQEDRARIKENARRRINGEQLPKRFDVTMISKNGEQIDIRANLTRFEYQGNPATLGILSDIRELRALESESLEIRKKLLEERLKAEQIEKLDRIKTEIMNTATHEIRTPITSIRGYSELILDALHSDEKETALKYFEVVIRNVDRLELLSSDLLDMQRIESGRLMISIKKCKISEIIEELKNLVFPLINKEEHELNIDSGEDFELYCDKTRILQVLINFINNAFKYSPPGTDALLKVEKDKDVARFSVIDNGYGIDAEDIPKLFRPFPEIRIPEARHGSGLGLSISKGIIDLHGGKIWVESEGRGKGSKFSFYIPIDNKKPDEKTENQ